MVFKGCKFMLGGTFTGTTQTTIESNLCSHGADKIVKSASEATYYLCSKAEWEKKGTKTASVIKRNEELVKSGSEPIYIISIEWVDKSILSGTRMDEKDYVWDKDDKKKASTVSANGNGKSNGKTNKRARSEEDEDQDKKKAPKMVTVQQKGRCPVDPACSVASSTHVYSSPDGLLYDATLNQVNAGQNNNKFYYVQVLQSDSNTNQFYCWTHWGRVGEKGQSKLMGPQLDVQWAIREFNKKFREKSKYDFSRRDEAAANTTAGQYTYIERSYEDDEDEAEDHGAGANPKKKRKVDDDSPPPAESKLPPRVKDLMKFIFNTDYQQQTLKSLNYDANKMPLGKLSKNTINHGFQALKSLAAVISDPAVAQSEHNKPFAEVVAELSNRYFTVIPHDFGRSAPPVINNMDMVKKEVDVLENLSDMEIATEIMKSAQHTDEGGRPIHALDSHYKGLNLERLDLVEPASKEYRGLEAYLANTHGETHSYKLEMIDAFKISRPGELDRYRQGGFDEMPNGEKRLLWHGSRATNFGGILSQGLRIAPPSAPVNGYMFAKGVYLADMVSKSANYCYPSISGNEGLLLLCEAQLGPKPFYQLRNSDYEADKNSRAAGFQSTWGIGRTQPAEYQDASAISGDLKGIKCPSLTIPAEQNKESSTSLQYNEFIIYDIAQIRLRYLLRVSFNHRA